ncbi:hypothetical protein K469DRAFT_556754, partial [Zopfia rhizophila CBS 207.26]
LSPWKPTYYFLYGTLTNLSTLQYIFSLKESPIPHKAHTTGYSLAKWRDYPIPLDGPGDNDIGGYAYMVETERHAKNWRSMRPAAYEIAACKIHSAVDGKERSEIGRTFIYAGDTEVLKEGRFDWELLTKQMVWGERRRGG